MSSKKIDILLDSGTSYSKLYYLKSKKYQIILTREIKNVIEKYNVVAAAGHNARRFTQNVLNELIVLSKGAANLVEADRKATVVDCGSRDIKFVTINSNDKIGIDWNTECGAFTGQIVELLASYFKINPDSVKPAEKPIVITCAILAMTRMFDLIADGYQPQEVYARFVKGLACNVYDFCGKPARLYLSGGLCANQIFAASFDNCQVIPLGRYVLLEGLKTMI
ncbi:ATPase [bacterium]|nr:ATPase [bacterium]